MPSKMIWCMSLPPATITSVPINDFAIANERLAGITMDQYYPCCGKVICKGCMYAFSKSGNIGNCPYCKAKQFGKTIEEDVQDKIKRVEANDASSILVLASYYHQGVGEFLFQDQEISMEFWKKAAKLGSIRAHFFLGNEYDAVGDLKKAKFHLEAAAMAGEEGARCNLGCLEGKSGNMERCLKHLRIAASSGYYTAMNNLLVAFKQGLVSRDAIDSTLEAYNSSCAEMRSEARDNVIRFETRRNL